MKESILERAILVVLAIVVLTADQLTKYLVITNLTLGESWSPIPGFERYLSFTYVVNSGAAFGLFPNQGGIFAIIAVAVVVAILAYYRYLPAHNWLIRLSLALQLGGALGNLVDRFRFGHVIDFVDFKIWPVFNIADCAIVTGVGILAFFLMQEADDYTEDNNVEGSISTAVRVELPEAKQISSTRY